MKKIAYLFLPLVLVLSSCEKTTDNVSRITYFAEIVINGAPELALQVGDDYTDEGAKAFENGVEISVVTTNNVDTEEPGVYTVDYSATNVDGFTSTKSRVVAVLPGEAEPDADDPSGSYVYVATGTGSSKVNKIAPGFFYTTNTYSNSLTIAAYIFCLDGSTISIPEFESAFGPYYGGGTYTDAAGTLTYIVNIPAFGIFNRARNWKRV